jgi:putative transposase
VFELVHAERESFPTAFSCRVLGVSRSGYYRWREASLSARTASDERIAAYIASIHKEHKGRYGSPRIHKELQHRHIRTGRKRVARLMRAQGLKGRIPRRFKRTTDSRHAMKVAPNLLKRDFTASEPNLKWVGDITYIPTLNGWLYLAVLIDLFSRRVVGFSMSDKIDTELALGALHTALQSRMPAAGLIHHTDRDCRYASGDYQAALKNHEVIPSMSRKADCWDNAVAESFFATLEKELLGTGPLVSRAQARSAVADYIENYYNTQRRHSNNSFSTPLEHEMLPL